MKRVVIKENENGYEAVSNAIPKRILESGDSIIVQIRYKFSFEEKWNEQCYILLPKGPCPYSYNDYDWEVDWWEGQTDILLIAAAPVGSLKLPPYYWIEDDDGEVGI